MFFNGETSNTRSTFIQLAPKLTQSDIQDLKKGQEIMTRMLDVFD